MLPSLPAVFPALRLWLCVSLPLAVGWWLPRSYGASDEAFPLMVGFLAAGLIATVGLGSAKRSVLLWVMGVVLIVMLRRSPIPLYTLMLLPMGLAAWIGLALGTSAWHDDRLARMVVWGLVMGLGINLFSGGLQFFRLEPYFYPWFSINGTERIYGNLRQANHLATLFAAGLALLWVLAARRVLADWKIMLLVLAACLLIAVTGSRTGLLEVGVLAALALMWRRSVSPRVALVFIGAPLLVVLCGMAASNFAPRLEGQRVTVADRTDATTGQMRLLHWQAALDLIRAEPLLGVGWREYRYARFAARPQDSTIEVVENAHNTPLHLAAELGIPAALAILVPVGIFFVRRKPWRAADPRQQAAWMVLIALLIHSMLEHPMWYIHLMFLGAMAAGLVTAADKEEKDSPSVPRALGWGFAVLVLLAMVDYDRASAPYGRTLFNWGETAEARLESAQKSILFGIYADRALLPRVTVTVENHEAAAQLADRLMHYAPDPQIINVRLLAYCAGGDWVKVASTLRLYQLAYPSYFTEFRRSLPASLVTYCRL